MSGDIQGAGGVGGLLSVTVYSETRDSAYYPTYDANGNVSEYIDDTDSVVAHYEYSPFGKITSSSGSKASDFNHLFSTKYLDSETNLYYYGYRYYSTELGRWISRDPIEEQGGLNVYGFVRNNTILGWDYLGKRGAKGGKTECCGDEPYNPLEKCCCEETEKLFDQCVHPKWEGSGALSSLGAFIGGAVLHLSGLESDVTTDCKKYKVDVTAYFGGVSLTPFAGAVTFKITFESAYEPSDFKGLSSMAQAGGGTVLGYSLYVMDIGDAVTVGQGVSLGFELPGAEAYAGWSTIDSSREIPCEEW